MSVRLNSKLIDAAHNVVRLPTAQPTQVKQNYNRAARAARVQFRAEHPWPGEHMRPWQREQQRKAQELAGLERSPALLLVMSLLSLMDDETKQKALNIVEIAEATTPNCQASTHAAIIARDLCGKKEA